MRLVGGCLDLAQGGGQSAPARSVDLYITDEPQHDQTTPPPHPTPSPLASDTSTRCLYFTWEIANTRHLTEKPHDPATMSSGEVLKADKDFTKEVDAAIPEAEKLASVCLMAFKVEAKLI